MPVKNESEYSSLDGKSGLGPKQLAHELSGFAAIRLPLMVAQPLDFARELAD